MKKGNMERKAMKRKAQKTDVKRKVKNKEELDTEEQALLAEIKLGQRKEYRDYVKNHNRELRRLQNEAMGIFEPEGDYE